MLALSYLNAVLPSSCSCTQLGVPTKGCAGYFTHPSSCGATFDRLCSEAIVVMETAQDRRGGDIPPALAWSRHHL